MKNVKKHFLKAQSLILCAVFVLCAFFCAPPYVSKADDFYEGENFRVGLVYGSGVKKVIAVSSTSGSIAGVQGISDGARNYYSPICYLPSGTLYVCAEGYGTGGTEQGGYHVQCTTEFTSYAAANTAALNIKNSLSSAYPAVPCYINGKYRVRVGDFSSVKEAESAASIIRSKAASYSFSVSSPSENCLSVYDEGKTLVFQFESDISGLGLSAVDGYMTYNKKTYDGNLTFSRYKNKSVSGVQLTSILPLEKYVMCVIPNEIMTSWQTETLKAFAITVRSYALSMKNNYESSYHFDITYGSQVYGMASKIDARTISAVRDTEGLVIAYNGTVAQAYYSSSTGGITVGSGDAYVTSYPYLKAVETPWEKYASLSSGYHGLWTVEYSGAELLSKIKSYGYASLKGSRISSLKVNSYGENSTYVKSITVTDELGNSATISNSDAVRTRLGLYSANFTVGVGSVSYSYDTVTTTENSSYYPSFNLSEYGVMTSLGKLFGHFSSKTRVQTSGGAQIYSAPSANVITGKNSSDGKTVYSVTTTNASFSGAKDSFCFAGKGYGHGVGLSQFGIRDLGNLGYSCDEMLRAYYTDIDILKYTTIK